MDLLEAEDAPMLVITRIPAPTFVEAPVAPARSFGTLDVMQSSLFRRTHGKVFALTSTGRNDGVGAQALAKITARVMAVALSQTYAHAAFQVLEHFDEGINQKDYCQLWEDLLQIGKGCARTQHHPLVYGGGCDTSVLSFMLSHNFQHNRFYILRDCHEFTEHYRTELCFAWKKVIEDLRTAYHGECKKSSPAIGNPVVVAVHIRRGDATETRRLLDNDYYLDVMRSIEAECPGKQFFFNVVSEGTPEDFAAFSTAFAGRIKLFVSPPSPNVRGAKPAQGPARSVVAGKCVPRNEHLLQRRAPTPRPSPQLQLQSNPSVSPAVEAFKVLVDADVLVMSRSAFSYVAALYSRGMKLHPPDMWWSVPKWCEDWDRWFTDPSRFYFAIHLS